MVSNTAKRDKLGGAPVMDSQGFRPVFTIVSLPFSSSAWCNMANVQRSPEMDEIKPKLIDSYFHYLEIENCSSLRHEIPRQFRKTFSTVYLCKSCYYYCSFQSILSVTNNCLLLFPRNKINYKNKGRKRNENGKR